MTPARSVLQERRPIPRGGRVLLAALAGVLAAAGCADPAPAGGTTAAPSASDAASSSGAPPVASAGPGPAASADAPAVPGDGGPSGSVTAAVPAAPPSADAPVRRASPARTGILGPGEADRILPKGQSTKVRLLEAGTEPREPLRYALDTGKTTPLEMGMTMTIELSQGARAVPSQKIPRIATLLDLTTAAAPTQGALGVEVVVREVGIGKDSGLPQQVAERLLPHLQGIQGLTLGYHVTPEGRVRQAAIRQGGKAAPADATLQQMSQSLESMIAPFPDEPVGVGARWEVVARFDSSGTELVQWSTFHLRERGKDGARLGLEVVQAAAQAEVHPPNLPAGVDAKLVDFSSKGAGESHVDFASPAPRSATMKVDSTMTLAVAQGGGAPAPQTAMKSSMLVDLGRRTPGAAPGGAAPKPTATAPAP